MSHHDEWGEREWKIEDERKNRMIGIKEIIDLGQEATAWITGDVEISKETKTLDDACKAIKTALELGRESHSQLYLAKDIIYSLRMGAGNTRCWCQMAIGNPMVKDHSTICKQTQLFMGDYK